MLLEASGSLMYEYPDALLSFSECEYQVRNNNRAEEGVAAFDRLTGIASSQYVQAADLYVRLGKKDEALKDLAKAEPLGSQTAELGMKRAALLEKLDRLDEAQKVLEEQTSSQPTFESLFLLAKIAKDRGDFAVAIEVAETRC